MNNEKKNKINNNQGLTLVELIVSMAILLFLIAGAINLLFFGNRAFTSGSQQAYVQSDVRTVSDYIQREIRFATYAATIGTENAKYEIANYDPGTDPDPFNYLYFENNRIHHIVWNGSSYETTMSLGLNVTAINFESENNEKMLLRIQSEDNGNDYELHAEIVIHNLNVSETLIGGSIDSKTAIRYSLDPIHLGLSGDLD